MKSKLDDLRPAKVKVDMVHIGLDRDPVDEAVVAQLMVSIPLIGLLEPIVVRKAGQTIKGFELVAGGNRLESFKRLGHKTIPAMIEDGQDLAQREWADIAEIDENLVRSHVKDRSRLIAKQVELYKQAGNTDPHVGRYSGGRGRKNKARAATEEKLGASKTTVNRAVQEHAALGDVMMKRIEGTSLGTHRGKEKLMKATPPERETMISEMESRPAASKPKVAKPKPRRHRADFDSKSFVYGADDARNAALSALDDLKGKKYNDKVFEKLDRAADSVIAAWIKVKNDIAKHRENLNGKTA